MKTFLYGLLPWSSRSTTDKILRSVSLGVAVYVVLTFFSATMERYFVWVMVAYSVTGVLWVLHSSRELRRHNREFKKHLDVMLAYTDAKGDIDKLPPEMQEEVRIKLARQVLRHRDSSD